MQFINNFIRGGKKDGESKSEGYNKEDKEW